MTKREGIIAFFIFFGITALFFYKFFLYTFVPFPGDLLTAEYNPWKSYSYLGYNPGSYPNKAQYFDVLRQLYPWKIFSLSQLQNLQLPLWNPYNFSGAPLLANFQSAVFYPLNIFYFFGNTLLSWSFLVFLQPLLASFFTYLYARQIKIGKEGALLTAISFGFSHFMMVWLEYNTIGHTIAYLPLALLATERLLIKQTAMWSSVFIFALVSVILAGHIQLAGFIGLFLVAYLLVRAKRKKILSFSILFFLSFGISGIQLLPGVDLIGQSARVNHDYSFLLQKILIQPYQLIMLFVPDFFGNPATRNYFLQDTYIGKVTSIGLVALFFAACSLFLTKNLFVKFFLITTGVILVLVTNNPFTALLYSIPLPLLSSSAPTLSTFLLAFSLSVLAGFGLDAIKKKSVSKNIVIKVLGFFTIPFLIIWFLLFFLPEIFPFAEIQHNTVATKALLYQTGLLGILIAAIVGYIFLPKKTIILLIFLILLQGGETWRSFHKFNPFVPQDLVFPKAPVLEYLQENTGINRLWGYKAAGIEANFATAHSLFSPDGYDPLYPKRYGEFISLSNNGKLLDTFTVNTRSDAKISQEGNLMENNSRLLVFDLLGVGYILDRAENASTERDFPSSRFEKLHQDNGWVVYKNLLSLPRVYLASSYSIFTNKNEFEKKFTDKSFNPRDTILLEAEPEIKPGLDKDATVIISSYTPGSITFKTESSENQLLFISDTFFLGWLGSVDGNPSDILRANYAFRAMEIPKGNHTVIMEYKPQSYRNGMFLTLGSFIIMAGYLFFLRGRKV